MMSIEETIKKFDNTEFNIQHPYADFTFNTSEPIVCGGGLCVSIWNLKGKISLDGEKWYDVEALNPNDDKFVQYYYDCIFNIYGWVYQDIYATFNNIIKYSIFKNIKIISLSNKETPTSPSFNCVEIPKMDRKLLLRLDEAKRAVSKKYDVTGVTLTDEQIININLNVSGLPSINLIEESISGNFSKKLFDIEKDITYILNKVSITRFTIGKINQI